MRIALPALTQVLLLGTGILWFGSCAHPNRDGKRAIGLYMGETRRETRYSSLRQIDRNNVKDLQVVWMYDSNDPTGNDPSGPTASGHRRQTHEIQCQPIVVHGILYGTTGTLKLFALDAATGKEIWKFDPFAGSRPFYHQNRGVAYWEDGEDRRILYTAGPNLYEVDARKSASADRCIWHTWKGRSARRPQH